MTAAHLVVGADEHGVVRHALDVARSCADPVLRAPDVSSALQLSFHGHDVVHVAFTDRLFGETCEQAAASFGTLAARVSAHGARLSVTLHDVPLTDTSLDVRRRHCYGQVATSAVGVVVSSLVELAAIEDHADRARSLRCIPLPVQRRPTPSRREPTSGRDAAVLGFVFPDRGYEAVLDALPPGSGLVALGRAAAGHEHVPGELAALARARGRSWLLTGFLPDDELAPRLAAAAVPVAPNRRVGASGSIGTWLAHGRRPIVPSTPYTRELADRMPGSLALYEPDETGALAAALLAALADPGSTWLPPSTRLGPSEDEVARDYRDHLAACGSPRVSITGGVERVPGNRWDLLPVAPVPVELPISVVVPYYDDQRHLDLVLTALSRQTVAARTEIIVADDGSALAPDLSAAGAMPARLVRQARNGFGAARARNLGARSARGEVLAFLDGDTVPGADYLQRLVELPSRHADGLSVGHRRHADFAGWTPEDVAAWLDGRRSAPPPVAEPDWLADAYRDTHDLRDAGPGAYRYVISAVLALRRELFERLGGFDERFTDYGGEDWEFANRAWHAGALVKHERYAQAWHDGPDWGRRSTTDARRVKNAETLALSKLLPDPTLRGAGQWLPYPHVVVRTAVADAADLLATARSAFAAGVDCAVWVTGPDGPAIVERLADPRILGGDPPADVMSRAAAVADVQLPCDLGELATLAAVALEHGQVRAPAVTVRSARAIARCGGAGADDVDGLVGRLFGRHDRSRPAARRDVWLDASLGRLAQGVRRS